VKTSVLLLVAIALMACGAGPPPPAALDVNQVTCASCRMIVSDHRFASQLASRREEPRFFDDLGCLASFIEGSGGIPPGSVIYVADHRTNRWVALDTAVLTHVDAIAAPMGSHVIAHESPASRDADPAAAHGRSVDRREITGEGR
jgi:copper chaperone NosL